MARTMSGEHTFMDAKAANGAGLAFFVKDYKTIKISLNTASSANGLIRFQGAISQDLPAWASAQSPTNRWTYVQVVDTRTGSTINGDTGVNPAATDANRVFEYNTNGETWVNVILSSYVAGTFTVKGVAYSEA